MREALVFLLVLACPLLMIWMMRGGRGHGSHDGGCHSGGTAESIDDLRRRRDDLDRLIAEREAHTERPEPIDGRA